MRTLGHDHSAMLSILGADEHDCGPALARQRMAEISEWRERAKDAEAKLRVLEAERDEDRYPTRWAYEQVCAASNKWQAKAEAAEALTADLVGSLTSLIETWKKCAGEMDEDGDYCCSEVRFNDADELEVLLRSFPHQQKEEDLARGEKQAGLESSSPPHRNSGDASAIAPDRVLPDACPTCGARWSCAHEEGA